MELWICNIKEGLLQEQLENVPTEREKGKERGRRKDKKEGRGRMKGGETAWLDFPWLGLAGCMEQQKQAGFRGMEFLSLSQRLFVYSCVCA